jgi:hypothetical protein
MIQQPVNMVVNGLIQMETLMGNPTFLWNGETFKCVPNTLNTSEKNVRAGLNVNADFRMTVRLTQFSPGIYPQLNDTITYLGFNLLIKGVKFPGHGLFMIITTEQPSTGN